MDDPGSRSDGWQRAIIVAGPTASGKSALALALAQRLGGVVINADLMQVYRELRVLTARPTQAEEALVPHALYGIRAASEPGHVAWWRESALAEMDAAQANGLVPILCGGTGLYLDALVHGIAGIPAVAPAVRSEASELLQRLGAHGLHQRLVEADPETAARLRPSDAQRLARAWEVWRGTGRGLAGWLAMQPRGVEAGGFALVLLDPPRAELRAAIAARFAAMLDAGAVEEVRELLRLHLDPALPAMRAHGVPELAAHLKGEIGLAEAARRAVLATGRYVKRQATWFRHHKLASESGTHTIHARIAPSEQLSERNLAEIIDFIRHAA